MDDVMRSKEWPVGVIQGIGVGEAEAEAEGVIGIREWVIVIRPVIVPPPIVGR